MSFTVGNTAILELFELSPCELRVRGLPSGKLELDSHLEAEVDHP